MRHQPQRRQEVPRWLLVVWPGAECPTCIPLGDETPALARGAVVVAREDAELTGLITEFQPYMDPRPRLRLEEGGEL
jgi:hypothetical protein